MPIQFEALATQAVRALQKGAPDAYGLAPQRCISDGSGIPCRHCLKDVAMGEAYLVVAYRPFQTMQPYAETGPIFLHAAACERAEGNGKLPEILTSPDYIVRGYDDVERIVYGTGAVVPTKDVVAYAAAVLADDRVAFVHVRSASNNCFQCRVDSA